MAHFHHAMRKKRERERERERERQEQVQISMIKTVEIQGDTSVHDISTVSLIRIKYTQGILLHWLNVVYFSVVTTIWSCRHS